MRFKSVRATFGCLNDKTLEVAPGLTVVYGVNEAGKSTWHAAMSAALCGVRRGPGVTGEEREFRERRRPWRGDGWTAGALLELDDGHCIDIRHDLDGKVNCQAVDGTTGRDLSQRLMFDGAPDGSVLLGLNRKLYSHVACIRQADILAIQNGSQELQQQLQRTVASPGAQATAAKALANLAAFKSTHVGLTRSNSTGRLALAQRDVARWREQLSAAEAAHQRHMVMAQEAHDLRAEAHALDERRKLIEARRALREADAAEDELRNMREIAARHPAGPPDDLGDLIDKAINAETAVRAFKAAPWLTGDSAQEISQQLQDLPDAPEGDTSVHPSVTDAERAWRDAKAGQLALESARRATPGSRPWTRLLEIVGAVMALGGLGGAIGGYPQGWFAVAGGMLIGGVALLMRRSGAGETPVYQAADELVSTSAERLRAALVARGADVDLELDEALAAYQEECRGRQRQLTESMLRPALEERLASRERDEGAVAAAMRQVAAAAAAVGLDPGGSTESLVTALEEWHEDFAARQRANSAARDEWKGLQLLRGQMPEDVRERKIRELRAQAAALDPCGIARTSDFGPDLGAALQRAMRDAADAHTNATARAAARDQFGAQMPNVAEAEVGFENAVARVKEIRGLEDVLKATETFLVAAQDKVQHNIAPILSHSVGPRLNVVTAGRYPDVLVDPADLNVTVTNAVGERRAANRLSHGTAEQVYLLLRVALAELFGRSGESVPLLLDDVTVNSDRERTAAIMEVLHEVSKSHQVVLFTQENDVLEWAETHLDGPLDSVVRL